jgi:flagellar protein FliS
LKTDSWDGADGLIGLYNYAFTALINANIQRDPALTREAIELLEPLRQAWHEAAAAVPAPAAAAHGTVRAVAAAAPAAPAAFAASGAWNTQTGTGGGSLGFG